MKNKLSVTALLLIAIFSVQVFFAAHVHARENKDVVLVLDTSLSMIGYDGRNILEEVKRSIADYVDSEIIDGDTVTFMTFDTEVKIYPTVIVDDENDRDIIKKYISMTEAEGEWTHTHQMIQKVLEQANELEDDDKDRPIVIVVMTDARDDPPPGKRMEKFDVEKTFAKPSKRWVYLVNFSDVKKNEKMATMLKRVSDKVSVIEGRESPEEAMRKHAEELKKLEAESRDYTVWYIIGAVILLLILLILFFLWRQSKLKVAGKLEYWNNEVLSPYIEKFNMTRKNSNEIIIGKGTGIHVHIRDINVRDNFSIMAVRNRGNIEMALRGGEGFAIEYVNKGGGENLQDGDIFKVGNYTFKFIAD